MRHDSRFIGKGYAPWIVLVMSASSTELNNIIAVPNLSNMLSVYSASQDFNLAPALEFI